MNELLQKITENWKIAAGAAAGVTAALVTAAVLAISGGEPLPATASRQTNPTDVSLAGSWEVFYVDRALGAVGGRAIVDENEGSVTVRLVHPVSGERFALRSTSFVRQGDVLRAVLEGEAPDPDRREGALGQELALGAGSPYEGRGPQSVTLTLGETTQEISLREPEPASRQRVELELTVHPEALTGMWTQIVNPETGRDQDDAGRMGEFSYLNDGTGRAMQRGYESWSRPRPKIHLVVPYTDQYATLLSGTARFPYAWNEDGSLVTTLADRRYLMVIGEGLPIELGEAVTIVSNNDRINYELEAKPFQLEDRPTARAMVESAWRMIEADLRRQSLALSPVGTLSAADEANIAQTMRELRDLDFLLVRAELANGAFPGKTSFRLNNAEGTWSLRYGDLAADFTFARPLPGGSDRAAISEPVDFAFAPDKLYLELRTTKDVPIETQLFQIWVNDEPRLFDGWRSIEAVRLPVTEEDRDHLAFRKERVLHAGGDPDDVEMMYVYRSPAIALVPAGAAAADAGDIPGVEPEYRIPVNDGDIIRGVLATPDDFRVTPAYAEMRVASSPAELVRYTLGGDAAQNLTWTRALDQARTCVRINPEPPYDWDAIARMTAHTFTNTIILQGERVSLDMKVGDLAAMLVLRDVFIEMLTRQERNLAMIATPAEVASFRAQSEVPVTAHPGHPLADMAVTAPSGEALSFSLTYADDEYLVGRYGITAGNVASWRESTTREIIAQYLVEVRNALNLARNTASCGDYGALIELTGRGFDGVYRYALGRLVSTESTALAPGEYWKPDRHARAWLLGIPTLASALQAQRQYSAADTRAVVTGTMLATGAVGLTGGLLGGGAALLGGTEAGGAIGSLAYSTAVLSQVGQALAFTLDVAGVATAVTAEFVGKAETLAEIEFARGAALAIGTSRLERAIEEDKSYFDIAVSLYPEIAFAIVGNYDVAETFGILKRFGQPTRINRLTDNIVRGGSRTVEQADAVQRGRALFGEVAGDARVAPSQNALPAANPPAIEASAFDEAFPDADTLEAVSSIRIDDLRNPADPNSLRPTSEIAPDPQAVFGAPGDTIAAAGPSPQAAFGAPADMIAAGAVPPAALPPPGAFSGSATQPVAVAADGASRPPANVADFQRANREAFEALENARNAVEAASYAGTDLTAFQTIRFEADAQTYMAQSLLATAAREAQNAGLTFAEIDAILAARAAVQNPMGARFAMIRDLEAAAVQRLGFQILPEPDAVEILDFVTRALNNSADAAGMTAEGLARLKQWIDTYAQSGIDFFDQMRRMGTFSDIVEEAGEIVNPGAGFEAIADAQGIAALRRVAEENGLIASTLERTVAINRTAGQPALNTLDDVRALQGAQAMDAFAAMADARRVALTLGEAALDRTERVAYGLSQQALSHGAGGLPDWARALDRAAYDVIRPLAARADIRAFAQSNPAELAAFTRDADALTALRRQPYASFDELVAEVARERARIKTAVAGFFEQTSADRWRPKDLVFEDTVFSANTINPDIPPTVFSATRILKDGNEVGAFERELETFLRPDGTRGRQMVFSYANGKDAPRFLPDVDVPLVEGRGAPLATFMNVRAFNNLGISFGDPGINRIKMSQVLNANTSVEIEWMRRMYDADTLNDYLRHTHSVRYAESALNQAGYRIVSVQLDAGRVSRGAAGDLVNGEYFNAVEAPLDFLRRYGIDPQDVIETGHNILIDIVPL